MGLALSPKVVDYNLIPNEERQVRMWSQVPCGRTLPDSLRSWLLLPTEIVQYDALRRWTLLPREGHVIVSLVFQ